MGIKHTAVKVSGEKGYAADWNDDHVIEGDVDFNKFQLLQAVVENRVAWPAGPVEGQIIQRTDEHKTYVWNGTEWVDLTIEGTKDFFIPLVNVGEFPDYKGFFATVLCALNESGRLTTRIPHDFHSLVEVKVVFIPNEIVGQIKLDVFVAWSAVGEAYNAHEDDLIVTENAPVRNQVMELDFTAVMAGIAAGDYFGAAIYNLSDTDVHILGVRIRYV